MKVSERALRKVVRPEETQASASFNSKPSNEVRLYRLPAVLSRIPVSRSSWFAGIQKGRYPQGLHLGPRTTVWRSDDIDRVIESLGAVA